MKKMVLKESQLRAIITESVKKILNEYDDDDVSRGHIDWDPKEDRTLAAKGYTPEKIQELVDNGIIDEWMAYGDFGLEVSCYESYCYSDNSSEISDYNAEPDSDMVISLEDIKDPQVKKDFEEAFNIFMKNCIEDEEYPDGGWY